jgi:hypothetical protein
MIFTLRYRWILGGVHLPQILQKSYSCTVESILTGCITAWYGNCLASDCKALQRVERTAQSIAGVELPAIQDLCTRWCWWCQRKALEMVKDSSHTSHRLFSLLPSGKRYRCNKPQAIRLINSLLNSYLDYLHLPLMNKLF